MHKRITITLILILCIGMSLGIWNWMNAPMYAVYNQCSVEDLVEDMDGLNKAISKMGPYYQYEILPDGTLKVNRGDGKWLILKYKKGD